MRLTFHAASSPRLLLALVGASVLAAVAVAGISCGRSATGPARLGHVRVLFIGNSYTFTNYLPGQLTLVTAHAAASDTVETGMVARAGYSLRQHWVGGSAVPAIREGGWDFVVLQDYSLGPIQNPAEMQDYAARFDEEIRRTGAKTVLFITWAPQILPHYQTVIDSVYLALAETLGARAAPVGPAWQSSLEQRPDIALYDDDGSHPAPDGTYLSAAVFYAVLFGRSPVDETASEQRRFLQAVAWQTANRPEYR